MQKGTKFYSKEEDLVILAEVKVNPQNLTLAFKNASLKLTNRGVESIKNHWYLTLKDKVEAFTLNGHTTLTNTKVEKNSTDNNSPLLVKSLKTMQEIVDNLQKKVVKLNDVLNPVVVEDIIADINNLKKFIG